MQLLMLCNDYLMNFKKNKKGETVLVQDEYIRECRVKIFILFRLSLFIIIFILFLRSLMNYELLCS